MKESSFADRLALAMHNKRVTQGAMATALEVSQSTVSRWLNGALPHKLVTVGIAKFLNVDMDWLRSGKGEAQFFSVWGIPEWTALLMRWASAELSDDEKLADVQKLTAESRLRFGIRVHLLRTHLRLGVNEFAAQCGIAPSYLSRIESGARLNPSYQIVDKIMTVVPVMRAWLLWGDPPILVPEKHRKGNNERVVSLLMQMEDEERARLDESHRNALRQLADDKMLATADLVKMIESLKEWAARDERARTARDFLVDALTARISKERGAKR